MKRTVFLLSLLAACKPGKIAAPGALQKAFEAAPNSALCRQNLPQDWASTWPLPTGKPNEYKILFYALDRRALDRSGLPTVRVLPPQGQAVFTADGKVSACQSKPEAAQPLKGERYAKKVMAMEEEEFEKNSRKLLSLTETLAGSFARGAAADPKTASEFRTQFSLMAEPNLREDYERAVPEFWKWLPK